MHCSARAAKASVLAMANRIPSTEPVTSAVRPLTKRTCISKSLPRVGPHREPLPLRLRVHSPGINRCGQMVSNAREMFASTRRSRDKRQTVESCLTLAIERLVRERVLVPGSRTGGTLYWTNAAGEPAAWVGYEADMTDPASSRLRLRYAAPDPGTGQPRPVDQQVSLMTTRLSLGGLRWWFVDDGRRVGRLYLPLGGGRFRSRLAHGLVYASQYETSRDRPRRRGEDKATVTAVQEDRG